MAARSQVFRITCDWPRSGRLCSRAASTPSISNHPEPTTSQQVTPEFTSTFSGCKILRLRVDKVIRSWTTQKKQNAERKTH